MANDIEIRDKLMHNGLKVTPQRVAVLEALFDLRTHPTADNIIEYIRQNHPNIAVGTVYKTLETFVEKSMIQKIVTENNVMRYDGYTDKHHHIYFADSDNIEDYYDDDLNNLIEQYFNEKKIPNFKIEDIKLQIVGRHIPNSH
ncbi:MAG: transcriptional repressor [Bacteroidota bacterium]|nr:transcriptional repressor [Bacteroidota bacterium]